MNENGPTPLPSTTRSLTWSDIQRKVVSTRIVSPLAFRSAHQCHLKWWPTLVSVFWVQR